MQSRDEDEGRNFLYRTDFEETSDTWHCLPLTPASFVPGVIRDFTHLRRAGEFSDAIIRVGNVSFPVHRNILACCSPYFRALFTNLSKRKPQVGESSDPLPSSPGKDTHPYPAVSDIFTLESDGGEVKNSSLKKVEVGWVSQRNSPLNRRCTSGENSPLACPMVQFSDSQLTTLSAAAAGVSYPFVPGRLHASPSTNRWKDDDAISSTCQLSNLVSTGLVPVPRYEVILADISPETMNEVIEHAYGGHITVAAHNVEQLLPAADRFQVTSLLKECCDFLYGELSIGNCISIVKFVSHFYQCDSLREKGTKFLLDNFTAVFQTSPEFEKLTCKELISILKADQLNVRHEELVLDAIIRWVIADLDVRQKYIPELVACARVGLMLPDNMRQFVDSWLLCSNLSSDFNKVTLQVMESVLQLQKQQMAEVDSAMFSPRLPRDILLVIGGSNFGFPLNLVEAFDCRTWLWSTICPYEFAPRSYHGMVTLENEVFIIGGFSGQVYLSSCCKLNPENLAWEDVTPMNTKRCYVGVAELKGHIYAVGGYDGVHRLNSAEKFNKANNQWSFICPMTQQRSDAGIAVVDDMLYVCGGFNGNECIRAVEMYNPDTDQWSSVPSMPRGRSGLGLVAHNQCLYAVGGFDGTDSSVRLSTMECYDPETRQWTRLEPMPHPRSNLAVEVLEGVLYAIGGYSGDRTTSVVECYDFASNSWYQSTRLSHNRSALGACVVRGLPNTADILRRDRPAFRHQVH